MNPVILPREAHSLSRKLIDPEALKVLYGLHKAGFRAYMCGGGVRDLLLGLTPKDFDIATDARPEQVRRTFRNSRIIGRRFRLVHVFFREKIVEVSTFRRRAVQPDDGEEDLLITEDNVFGTAEEDALRRDFTVNGLFYDIGTFAIIDYVGGLSDLKARVIRSIGEPSVRFREDPVRMIRAVKLAARLNFAIDAADWEAIRAHAPEITKSAPPRLQDELLKILKGGAAERAFQLLEETGLMDALLPELRHFLDEARIKETAADREFYAILRALDRSKEKGRVLDNAVSMAAVCMPWLVPPHIVIGRQAAQRLLSRMEPLQRRLSIGKRDSQMIRNILVLQHRLRGRGRELHATNLLLRRRALPCAIDLAEIAAVARGQELPAALADLHERSSHLWDRSGKRVALLPGETELALRERPRRRRRRRRGKAELKPSAPADRVEAAFAMVPTALALPVAAGGPQPSTEAAGRKRRRRRGGRRRRHGRGGGAGQTEHPAGSPAPIPGSSTPPNPKTDEP